MATNDMNPTRKPPHAFAGAESVPASEAASPWVRHAGVILAAIIAGALVLRVVSFAGYQSCDDKHYIVHAYLFAEQGRPGLEHPTAWLGRTGVWLPMAACIRLLGPNNIAFSLYSLLCSVAGLILAYKLGRLVFDTRTALLGTFLLAFFPLDVIFATHPYVDVPFGLFMVLTLYLFLLGETRGSGWYYLASGIAAGVAWLHKEPAVFLVFIFLLFVLRRRAIKRTYLLIVLGGVLVVLCESAFWKTVADDSMYRFTAISGEAPDLAERREEQQLPTWKILLHLHQGGKRETISLLEPLVMFVTNQEFGVFYFLIWPVAAWLILRKQPNCSDLLLWTVGLGLLLCYFPIVFPYPLARDPRYYTPLSVPGILLLAHGLWQWRPLWRWTTVGVLLVSSSLCIYVDGSRHMRDNERELIEFRQEHLDADMWVDPARFGDITMLSGFRDDPRLKIHFASGMSKSKSFQVAELLCPDVEMAESLAEISSGYVVIRLRPGEHEEELPAATRSWRLVRRIPGAHAPHPIAQAMIRVGVPDNYVARLYEPAEGERLTVWQVDRTPTLPLPQLGGNVRSMTPRSRNAAKLPGTTPSQLARGSS